MNIGQVVHYIGDTKAKRIAEERGIPWSPLQPIDDVYGIVIYMDPGTYGLLIECRVILYCEYDIIRHSTINFFEFELEVVGEV